MSSEFLQESLDGIQSLMLQAIETSRTDRRFANSVGVLRPWAKVLDKLEATFYSAEGAELAATDTLAAITHQALSVQMNQAVQDRGPGSLLEDVRERLNLSSERDEVPIKLVVLNASPPLSMEEQHSQGELSPAVRIKLKRNWERLVESRPELEGVAAWADRSDSSSHTIYILRSTAELLLRPQLRRNEAAAFARELLDHEFVHSQVILAVGNSCWFGRISDEDLANGPPGEGLRLNYTRFTAAVSAVIGCDLLAELDDLVTRQSGVVPFYERLLDRVGASHFILFMTMRPGHYDKVPSELWPFDDKASPESAFLGSLLVEQLRRRGPDAVRDGMAKYCSALLSDNDHVAEIESFGAYLGHPVPSVLESAFQHELDLYRSVSGFAFGANGHYLAQPAHKSVADPER